MSAGPEWQMGAPAHVDKLECDVVGNMLFAGHRFDEVSALLPEMFYSGSNAALFEAMSMLARGNKVINRSTVYQWLVDHKRMAPALIEQVTDALHARTPSISNLKTHVAEIRDRHLRRRVRDLCLRFAGRADVVAEDIQATVGELVSELAMAGDSDGETSSHTWDEALKLLLTNMVERSKPHGGTVNVGFTRLDTTTGGIRPSELVIIGARTGVGKTAMLLQIALNVRRLDPAAGMLYFSLEMAADELANRVLSSHSDVSSVAFHNPGAMKPAQTDAIHRTMAALKGAHMRIEDTHHMTLTKMRSRLRHASAQFAKQGVKLRVVFVDYLQLITAEAGRNASREREVAIISQTLKGFAREFRCVVIAACQLGKEPERASGKKGKPEPARAPDASDVRESQAIAFAADMMWLIHPREGGTETVKPLDLVVAKSRRGPKLVTRISFEPRVMRLRDPLPDELGGADWQAE